MQTFLPYKDFQKSVQCLDNARLGKQRVEAMQIIRSFSIPDYGWRHHPVCKMWKQYPDSLKLYMNLCIKEWIKRGFKNTMKLATIKNDIEIPEWLGNERLHESHKSNLLRKDKQFYSQYDWQVNDQLPYYWCGFAKQDKEIK